MKYSLFLISGICFCVLGIINIKGNINAVHWYNRRKVTEEDKPKYAKAMGIGTLIIGVSYIVAYIVTFFSESAMPFIVLTAMAIGLAFMLYAQFKYNHGIF